MKLLKIDTSLIDNDNSHWNSQCTLDRMRSLLVQVQNLPDDIRLQADLALQLSALKAPYGLWPSYYTGREVDAWRAGKAAEVLEQLNIEGRVSGVDALNAKLAAAYWRTRPLNMAGELVHDIRALELASSGLLTAIRLMCNEAYHLSGGGHGTQSGDTAAAADLYAEIDRKMLAWANKLSGGASALSRPEVKELRIAGIPASVVIKDAVDSYMLEAPQGWVDVCPC